MHPQPRSEGTPTMSLRFDKTIGVALLLAAGLFVLVLALSSQSPSGVGADPCPTETAEEDRHVDFRPTGVSCTESTHDDPHEHTIEVDGGRDVGREEGLVFKAYVPQNSEFYGHADDKIVIRFDKSFDLPDSLTLPGDSSDPSLGLITISKGEPTEMSTPSILTQAIFDDQNKKLTLVGATDFTNGTPLAGEYITITIKAGTGIETPETPQGFDNFEDEEPYEVFIDFVDGNTSAGEEPALDKNFVVVKNPISSTVPGATVRVELHTHAEAEIQSTDEIIVDFSGPSADSGFILPTSIATSRIQVDYKKKDSSSNKFNPSEVQIQGERVIFAVPFEKDDAPISVEGDYSITFSNLARIKNPFSAGIKTIKVSSFVIGDEEDIIEAVVRRTTTVTPPEGPRGSEFTLEGKGYAPGTVTVYHDADGKEDIDDADGKEGIDLGETLASVKTVRGAFKVKLTARGKPGEPSYTVRIKDSEGVDISEEFDIKSSISFEPPSVGHGSRLTIIISDWGEDREEVVAVQIAGKTVFTAQAFLYDDCIEHPDAYGGDSQGKVILTVKVPSDIPPGDQTVAVFDHKQLDYSEGERQIPETNACPEEVVPRGEGFRLEGKFRTDDPIAITKATVGIVANPLEFSRSSAARGQRITITGSGFPLGTNGSNGIESVKINGIDVDEDPAQFEVTTSGDFAFTVTVPIGAMDGGNEVRVKGTESSLAQGTLDVPAASIELEPTRKPPG